MKTPMIVEFENRLSDAKPHEISDSWPGPADWLETLARSGDPVSTQIPALDLRLRRGMRPGRVCVVGGEPGAGKTALLLQIASRMAAAGAGVVYLARDEGPEAASIRLAQHLGISREEAERGVSTAIRALALQSGSVRLMLPDPDEVRDFRSTFERVAAWPEPRAIFFDSIQTIDLPDEPENLAQAVSARMDAIKKLARTTGAIVFVASEINRGGYARRRERTADLASFKNSGGIEYGADVALVVRPIEDRDGEISVSIVKNRLGTKGRFMLRLNPDTCLFSEVSGEEVERQKATESTERFENLVRMILEVVRPGEKLSGSQIAQKVKGRKQDVFEALQTMERTGRLKSEPRGSTGFLWSLPEQPVPTGSGQFPNGSGNSPVDRFPVPAPIGGGTTEPPEPEPRPGKTLSGERS